MAKLKMQDHSSDGGGVLYTIPRKTLEYFVSVYTSVPFGAIVEMTDSELIQKIIDAGYSSRIESVYLETIDMVEKEKHLYSYYLCSKNDHTQHRTPVSFDKIIQYLDDSHLFGKAVFVLLINLGSIETGNNLVIAEPKGTSQ